MQLCETAHLDEICWAGDADGEATCRESGGDLEVQWGVSLEVLTHVEVAHLRLGGIRATCSSMECHVDRMCMFNMHIHHMKCVSATHASR